MGCEMCTNDRECQRVSDGYVQIAGGMIVACRPGCEKCQAAAASECDVCSLGFFIVPNTNQCKKCPGNCRTCDPATPANCQSCWANQHLNGTTCNDCNANCLTCDSANLTMCKSCRRGLRLNSSTNTCVDPTASCGANCLRCDATDSTKCAKCKKRYAPTANGQCAKALTFCAETDAADLTQCVGCTKGFERNGTSCVRCPANAEVC